MIPQVLGSPGDLRRIPNVSEHAWRANTTPLSTENPFVDGNYISEDSLSDDSSISDNVKSLTPSQIDRICNAIDAGLTIPTFSPGRQVAPVPALVEKTLNSVCIDLSRLAVVQLLTHSDGSPKGLVFTYEHGLVQKVGDCRAEPGCVRVWHAPDLKYLVYKASSLVPGTRHPKPDYFHVDDIWFAAQENDSQTALPMSGTMTFQCSRGVGLSLDLRAHRGPDIDDSSVYRSDIVTPDGSGDLEETVRKTKNRRCKRILRKLVNGRKKQQAIVKRVGSAMKRMIKRGFDILGVL
ncbi:hypothetical protein VM1G_05904 [Cytospora mali]|uniref:Uncharacterized protein n=1 Tax=Cytospora mali TaxID=578113 RepID=A0A194W349_CYTMA|nr:hypothetical protein VM1G_05904 [Valsa mali]